MPGGKMSDIRRPPRYHQERAGRTGDREKRGGGGGGGATDKNLLGADGGGRELGGSGRRADTPARATAVTGWYTDRPVKCRPRRTMNAILMPQ